jgi:hypothetical protein
MMATNYGRDIYCLDELRPGRSARGILPLVQRCYHRLITERGSLRGTPGAESFGDPLVDMIGETRTSIPRLQSRIKAELRKEIQLQSVDVDVAETVLGPSVSYTVTIHGVAAEGEFTLVLGVDGVTTQLLGVTT